MPDTNAELRRTLHDLAVQPPSEARTAALESLLAAADAGGGQPLINEVLAEVVADYRWSEDSRWQITAFGRLLRNLDTGPEWFSPQVLQQVYWWMHAIVERMTERPDVPLALIEEFLDRARRHYAEAGRSLYSVHQAERYLADHIGDDERAARALAAMHANDSDYVDDCEPCVKYTLGEIYANAGDHERALELWDPMLRPGGISCPVEPDKSLAASLLPLVALGRLDQARANHLRGYRTVSDDDRMALPVAHHVRFCALTGNEPRAVEILTGRARLLMLGLNPFYRLRLLESVEVACRALAARGRGDALVPGPDGRPGRADDVRDLVEAERREICERFDRRNGNDVQSRRSAERSEFTGGHPHVPLGLKTAARRRTRTADHTAEEAVGAVRALMGEGRYEEALRVAEGAAAQPGPIRFAAAELAFHLGHFDRAELHAVEAAEHGGSDDAATAARHLAGLAMAAQDRHGAAVLVLESVLAELAEASENEQWRSVDIRFQLADSYDELDDPDEGVRHALEALRLMDEGVRHPDPTRYARTAHLAGVLLDRIDDDESAVLAFERAGRAWREIGALPMAARSVRAGLWIAEQVGDGDAKAFASLADELRAAWRDGELPEDHRESCRVELAETLYQHAGLLGDGPDAARSLRESLDALGEGPLTDREAAVAQRLMDVLAEAGDLPAAEAVAERLTERLDPTEHAAHLKAIQDRLATHRDAAER